MAEASIGNMKLQEAAIEKRYRAKEEKRIGGEITLPANLKSYCQYNTSQIVDEYE
ncbi:hypothetical protein OIU74_008121 [Salix koriyanagi]|uniref:Uncharacterized protein n=1 Tax=Salix koriyanagi TaxID=2511006 RepID=A0A9Q0Z716_9ROSI|nr:hypothetical protein OIU74_008121 [Salix koriyanagi]